MRRSDALTRGRAPQLAWAAAVVAGTAMLAAGCGTARAPGTPGTGATTVARADRALTSIEDGGGPAGSRTEATAYARRLLADLRLPAEARLAPWPSKPIRLLNPSLPLVFRDVVDLRVLYRLGSSMGHVKGYLLSHRPAGLFKNSAGQMSHLGSSGLKALSEYVTFTPRILPPGIYQAILAASVVPAPGGGSLLRTDAQVAWYPRRSAAEHIDASQYRSVTVSEPSARGSSRVTRTYTAATAVARLAALVNGLHAAPDIIVNCPDITAVGNYQIVFIPVAHRSPRIIVAQSGCMFATVTVGGRAQPSLYATDVLIRAVRRLAG